MMSETLRGSILVFNLSPPDGSSQFNFSACLLDEKLCPLQLFHPARTDKSMTRDTLSSVTLWFAMVGKIVMVNVGRTLHAGGQIKPSPVS